MGFTTWRSGFRETRGLACPKGVSISMGRTDLGPQMAARITLLNTVFTISRRFWLDRVSPHQEQAVLDRYPNRTSSTTAESVGRRSAEPGSIIAYYASGSRSDE